MRLIDADAMRKDWLENGQNEYVYDTNSVLDSIDCQPTIDPESLRPQGEWIPLGQYVDAPMVKNYKCSECAEWEHDRLNFCPNCGAKMKGDTE